MPTWGMWLVMAGLLLLRGFFAAIEAALQGISDRRARELALDGPVRGNRVVRLKTDPEKTAASIRLGLVLSGFTAVGVGTLIIPKVLDLSAFELVNSSWLPWLSPLSSALLVAFVATLVDIVFRSLALQKPEPIALLFSRLAVAATLVLYPMVRVLVAPLNVLLKPFNAQVSFQPPPPPLEDLEKHLITKAQHNELDRGAPQLIRSIFELNDKTCRDVMVPRTEVVTMSSTATVTDILQLVAEENHSRIPVYKDSVDQIAGILHVRDLVSMLQNPELIVLSDLLRPAVYVPWVKPIGDLLREMQLQRIHMAVVVDEYGGFSGIVTLEDILTEIVGDIRDEFEEDVRSFERQADDSVLVDALMPVEEFARTFGFVFPEGDFDTLGGFLANRQGAIPDVNDRVIESGWTFIVHSKQGPRLERIRVVKPKALPERRPSYERLEAVKA